MQGCRRSLCCDLQLTPALSRPARLCVWTHLLSMAPFEVDDISTVDMNEVKQLTAAFMSADGSGRHGAEHELAQRLHGVLKPYNKFSSSLLLKAHTFPSPTHHTLERSGCKLTPEPSCRPHTSFERCAHSFAPVLSEQRVETTIGCHVCAFFHECSQKCRYQAGGYSWNQEKLIWKAPLSSTPSLLTLARLAPPHGCGCLRSPSTCAAANAPSPSTCLTPPPEPRSRPRRSSAPTQGLL